MSYPDFSDPIHRINNLTNMKFVRAYALIRHHLSGPEMADTDIPYLRELCAELERRIAGELQLPLTTLVGTLVDIGNEEYQAKDAKDGGSSATG